MSSRDAHKRDETVPEEVVLNDDETDGLPLKLPDEARPLRHPLCQLASAARMALCIRIAMDERFDVALGCHPLVEN